MVYQQKKSPKKLQDLAIWQIVIILALLTLVVATLLRMNNVRMIERKEAVLAADKSGDLGMVTERLHDLQEYALKHMNASTGQVFLENTYRRKGEQMINDAKNTISSGDGQNAYKIASEICDQKFRGYSQAYAECFLSEVDKHTTSISTPVEIKLPSPNLFIHEYSSPRLSLDLAGLSVIIWLLVLAYLIIKIIFWLTLKAFISLK